MKKAIWKRKRFWFLAFILLVLAFLLSQRSIQIILQTAPHEPRDIAVEPALNVTSLENWAAEKEQIRRKIEGSLYGTFPEGLAISEVKRNALPELYFENSAKVQSIQLQLSNPANAESRDFGLILVSPKTSENDTPLIVMQNFCPNHDVVPIESLPVPDDISFSCGGEGMMNDLMHYWFGRYIVSPPFKAIMDQGYALAIIYPSEFIPDSQTAGRAELNQFFSNLPEGSRPGALMAWAAQSILIAEHFEQTGEFTKFVTAGHSRYGKTAILAAAYSDTIDAVISHQSGTAGASVFRDKPGETLSDIVNGYPHWLSKAAEDYIGIPETLPHDQHHLLALLAPRPILLGNAKRDVWSDPEGAFRAAKGATDLYELHGVTGLGQDSLTVFNPKANISYWLRPGTHGIVSEDWPAFLDFLNAHFK